MSLADCISKSGKALNKKDADAISSLADELESSGIDRTEAEIQAVDQYLATLESDIQAMLPEPAVDGKTKKTVDELEDDLIEESKSFPISTKERSEIENLIRDVTVRPVLDPSDPDFFSEVDRAIALGRPDVAEYMVARAERFASTMSTEVGVSKDSPKYESIKKNLENNKKQAIHNAKTLRSKLTPESLKQSAYHGTPHQFDEFSLEAMGTGEGVQAYGWGLYFAGNKSIAEYYRDTLTERQSGDRLIIEGTTYDTIQDAEAAGVITPRELELAENYEFNDAIYSVGVKSGLPTFIKAVKAYGTKEEVEIAESLVDRISAEKVKGNLYEVDIPEDSELLDHDKLLSDQPDSVKKALEGLPQDTKEYIELLDGMTANQKTTGSDLVSILQKEHGKKGASQFLDSLGIKGLKYLDANSRYKSLSQIKKEFLEELPEDADIEDVMDALKDGVFSPLNAAVVEALNQDDWLGFDYPAQAISAALGNDLFNWDPSDELIAAVKTLKDSGSRTHNYVIWDDKTISVEAVNEEKRQAALYQQGDETPRGMFQVLDGKSIISLSKKSDTSTFFHESMHMFIYMEGLFAKENGLDANQKAILEHVGAESFDTMTVEQHEILAESFEAYLMEGKSPSVRLADAFNIIRSWMLSVYRSVRNLPNQKLDDNLREIFDKMLATETEIAQFTASPEYKQLFKSKEQAGMTDAQWEKYNQDIDKRKKRAETSVMDRLIKQIKNRRTREWKKEKEPLIAEHKERLFKLPVYQILDNAKLEKMDTAAVKDIIGDNPKLLGKLIGKHKQGGIDPSIYSEAYEYTSPEQMFQDIEQTEALSVAAEKAAEAQMVAKYGDILNDGSMEREIHESLHSSSNADVLLAEIQALKKRTADINIPRLKYDAKLTIGKMTSSEIKPDRFRRLERAAALRAERAEATAQKMQEAYDTALNKKKRNEKEEAIVKKGKPPTAAKLQMDAKLEQLANHYLFKEASAVKAESTKWKKYIDGVRKRDYSPKDVDDDHINAMKLIANLYRDQRKGKKAEEQTKKDISKVIEFYNAQMSDKDAEGKPKIPNTRLQLLDPQVAAIVESGKISDFEFRYYKDMTMDELRGVYHNLQNLRHSGGKIKSDDGNNREAIQQTTEAVENSKKFKDKGRGDTTRFEDGVDLAKGSLAGMSNLRNIIRKFDGGDEYGANFRHVYLSVEDGANTLMRLTDEKYSEFAKEISGLRNLSINKRSNGDETITVIRTRKDSQGNTETYTKPFTLHREGRLMLALYMGTESSRKAIYDGHGISEQDAMRMMSYMTESELKLVNAIWKMNESNWSEFAKVEIAQTGVAPPKLEATPFVVNGIEMTGGHQTLYYRGQGNDFKTEREDGSFESLQSRRPRASKERVGSGGRKVDLSKDNITRSLDEVMHYIAFQPVTNKLAAILNDKDYKQAIIDRYGEKAYKNYTKTIMNVTDGRPDKDTHEAVVKYVKLLRVARTYNVLHYSLRNVVQQVSALGYTLQEIGAAGYARASMAFINPETHNQNVEFVKSRSAFMANRDQTIDRNASEFMQKIAIGGRWDRAWKAYKDHGFFLQTKVDSLFAYPVWWDKYHEEIAKHGDERIAISQADTAVSVTVGSGADIHLGSMYQKTNTELMKNLTQFGSWQNNMYNRLERDAVGFGTPANAVKSLNSFLIVPLFSVAIASIFTLEFPQGEDETDEEWLLRIMGGQASYYTGMFPVIRDIMGPFLGWFTKGTFDRGTSAPAALTNTIIDIASGEKEIDPATLSSMIKLTATHVPMGGTGNVTRILDFIESDSQGDEEGDIVWKSAKAVLSGPTRN